MESLIKKDFILLNKAKKMIKYEISEFICPVCGKKELLVHIEDQIVYGGYASTADHRGIICIDCALNDIREKFDKESENDKNKI